MENLLQKKYGYKLTLSEHVRKATLERVKLMEGSDAVLSWLNEFIEQATDENARNTMKADRDWFIKRIKKASV